MSEVDDSNEVVTKGYFRDTLRSEIRNELRDALRPIFSLLANHTAELRDIRTYMKTQLVTREEFHARMDAFAGRVDDHDYAAAKSRARLDDHERRISALEKKPS